MRCRSVSLSCKGKINHLIRLPRTITEYDPDGTLHYRRADLYRRGCFILEAKKLKAGESTALWDKAMQRAFRQAEGYARALPVEEGRPPLIITVDVGRAFEFYAEFSRTGGNYVAYPDPSRYRVRLEDLRDPAIQERFRAAWLDPDSLDLSRRAARVTRAISTDLAALARSLEHSGYEPERVSRFLIRTIFTMFAEDIGLIPPECFTDLMERLREHPEHFTDATQALWEKMRDGGFEAYLVARIPQFNGGLFDEIHPIPLNREQIELLIRAARHDWTAVEPAIFGTLLERALDPRERHKLGAHYTPRAYVERLVMPTVIEPLRAQWADVQAVASRHVADRKTEKARQAVAEFHHQLCETRVLDPACGTGNFLYVSMENMKRLEGEVLELLEHLSGGQSRFDTERLTVDPHQFLGLEINPRAAYLAEMVLWIGYLQWHYRLYGRIDNLPEPILRRFHNIQYQDAVLDYDGVEPAVDEHGEPRTVWDGTTKRHPTTGEEVPDETARAPVFHYLNPRRAEWPEADFVVGNPPFIGNKRMRLALGDGYVEALRSVYQDAVPESADFVLYWWQIAAEKARAGAIRRFGLITTNSLRQPFNRRVIEPHLAAKKPLALRFAVPDHPWVDSADGAAVRIAMTVAEGGSGEGTLLRAVEERPGHGDGAEITFEQRKGVIHADLTAEANVAGARALRANAGLSNRGVIPHGSGFIITPEQARDLGLGRRPGLERHIRPYRNGRDITQSPRGVMVIDPYPMEREELQRRYPEVYQWLLDRVKPDRDQQRDRSLRERWWLHRRNNEDMRDALHGLNRYIATVYTAKCRIFTFLDAEILPDDGLVAIASDDPYHLGVLTSYVHTAWAFRNGGTLEDRPRYNKARCFDPFPFPSVTKAQANRIRDLAARLDAHRAHQQAEHPGLTLTGMYNVLEKRRAGEALSTKERTIHDEGVVGVLAELHDELDQAVLEAYGWDDLADALVGQPGATTPLPDKPPEQIEAEEALLSRLVELNAQRAAEEAEGRVRWLRPAFQAPEEEVTTDWSSPQPGSTAGAATEAEVEEGRPRLPKALPDRIRVVREALAERPQTLVTLADQFRHKPKKSIHDALEALAAVGMASQSEHGVWRVG